MQFGDEMKLKEKTSNSGKFVKSLAKKTKTPLAPTPHEGLVKIKCPVQHVSKNLSFYRVEFRDLDGSPKWMDIPRRSFSKPTEAIGLLLDSHAKLPPNLADQKEALTDALRDMASNTTVKITSRLGWDGSGGDLSFVYFGKTFGSASNHLNLDDDSNRNGALGKRGGSSKLWKAGLEEPCKYSDHMILAMSIAASGPLYGIIGNPEPAIYHFQGAHKPVGASKTYQSSSGKTLSARCAQSLFGSCSRTDLFGFNMTPIAVEETCFSCNNIAVILDEEGAAAHGGGANTIDPKILPYRIIQGQGKRRSKAYSAGQGLPNLSWVVPVITTAEDQLDATASVRKEGAKVRMVAVPFPPSYEGGMFNGIAKASERNRLAKAVEETLASNFGVAMPKFLSFIVRDQTELSDEVVKIRDEFVKAVGAAGDTWERRYAEKFGILVSAATLMARYGIAPWTEKRAVAAITNLYNASRSLTISVPQVTDALVQKLTRLLAKGERFPVLGKGSTTDATHPWGFVRDVDGKAGVLVIKPGQFKKLVEPSAAADDVLKALDKRGMLIKGKDGQLKRQLLISGVSERRLRYVCLHGLSQKPKLKKKYDPKKSVIADATSKTVTERQRARKTKPKPKAA